MRNKKIGFVLVSFVLFFGIAFGTKVDAASLYSNVPVSDSGNDNTVLAGNTARKVAVGPDGTIYVVYHSPSGGVRIARSTNRGQSFEPSIQLDSSESEAEVAVGQDNTVYVAWVKDGTAGTEVQLSRSTDGGATFSQATTIGSIGPSIGNIHMAVSSPYVYIVSKNGLTLFRNSTNGIGDFTSSAVDSIQRVFTDIHVDPVTGYVYIQDDDPNILYFVSTNHGETFSTAQNPGYDVWYSTSAASFNASHKYLYINGGFLSQNTVSASLRVNLNDNSITTTPFSETDVYNSRTLAADELGNVVNGYMTGGNATYEVSTDHGVSVEDPVTVGPADYLSVAINPVYGDIVVAYSNGGSVFVSVYQNELSRTGASTDISTDIQTSTSSAGSGESFSLTGTITNSGYSPAIQTVATFSLPTNKGSISSSAPGCSNTNGIVTCTYAFLPAGNTRTIPLTIRTFDSTNETIYINTSISTTTTDSNSANNSDSVSVLVSPRAIMFNPQMFAMPNKTASSFMIDNGNKTTASSTVKLQVNAAEEIKSMAISNTPDFAGSGIQPLTSTVNWNLCKDCQSGQTYTVYMKLYTEYGHSIELSQSITYTKTNSQIAKTVTTNNNAQCKITRTLKKGTSGNDVLCLQKYLQSKQYLYAIPNGFFGTQTVAAVTEFQKKNSLPVDGIIGKKTAQLLTN